MEDKQISFKAMLRSITPYLRKCPAAITSERKHWKIHERGGGWVFKDAMVSPSAYIGKGAVVMAGIIDANCRISGEHVIIYGGDFCSVTIQGGIIVIGSAINLHTVLIEGRVIHIIGDARMSDSFIRGSVIIEGSAIIKNCSINDGAYFDGPVRASHCTFDGQICLKDKCKVLSTTFNGDGIYIMGTAHLYGIHVESNTVIRSGYWSIRPPLSFIGSKHTVKHTGYDELTIGCEKQSFKWWLNEKIARVLARSEGYTPKQIAEYKDIIQFIQRHSGPNVKKKVPAS